MSTDWLLDELHELGRAYDTGSPDVDAMAARVIDRLPEPTPVPLERRPSRRRIVVSAVAAILVMLIATPPVRAAVSDWFGIIVRDGPPATSAAVPPAGGEHDVEAAARLVGFEPVIPAVLGPPDGIEVMSDDRVLSMSWTGDGATIRLDQFEGELFPAFVKASEQDAKQIDLEGVTALWFPTPHFLVTIGPDGVERVETTRAAGPTLIWPVRGITLRLEGLDFDAATAIAVQTSASEGTP